MSGGLELADNITHGPRPTTQACALDATGEAVDFGVLLGLEEAQVEGEPDLVVELLDLYAEDTPRRLAAVRSAWAAGDLAALRRAAHGLKGSSAILGARQVAILCEKLERLSGEELPQGGEMLLTCLEREFARARLVFADERGRRLGSGANAEGCVAKIIIKRRSA
jgi:HPt (histidine-containing phosphotransfer) domain-containing protein